MTTSIGVHFLSHFQQRLKSLFSHQVIKDSTLVILIQCIVILTSFTNSAILARLLDTQSFGNYQLLLAWTAVASIWGLPGMNIVVMKSTLKKYDRFYWLALRRSLFSSCIGTILVALAGLGFLFFQGDKSVFALFLLLVAVSIPLSAFQNYDSVLIGKNDFKSSRLLNLLGAILTLICTGVTALLIKEIEWVFIAYLISRLLVLAVGFFVVRRKLEDCPLDLELESNLYKQGWRQTFLAIFILATSRLDRIILGAIDPMSLGFYHVGTLIPMQIKNNAKLMLNILAIHWGLKGSAGNVNALKRHGPKMLFMGAAVVILLWIVLPFGIPAFFSNKYYPSVKVGIIYSLVLLPAFWVNIIGMENQLHSDGVFNQRSQILRHAVLTICIVTLGHFGIIWIVISHIIADYCYALWSYIYLRSRFRLQAL